MGGGGALKYAMFNNQVIASVVDINGITNFTQFYYDDTLNRIEPSLVQLMEERHRKFPQCLRKRERPRK